MRTARISVCAWSVGAALLLPASAFGATPTTERVSVTSEGGQANGGSARPPAISANGRFVAFSSAATDLVPNDENLSDDVFVHDRWTNETTRVSVRSNGNEAAGDSSTPSLSANGRFVTFRSDARLVSADDDEFRDIFVHDRLTKRTTRVSVRSNGAGANGSSSDPTISANGRFVAFASIASNLVRDDDTGDHDVFVHDRETGKTERVSVRSDGSEVNFGFSQHPSISGSGKYVVFSSNHSTLVPNDKNGFIDAFIHNREAGTTKLVSLRSDGRQAKGNSFTPSISRDGRLVAFESSAENLVADDDNSVADIFVRNRETNKTERVSLHSNGDEAQGGDSREPSLSGDGRYVAFESSATDLVTGDGNAKVDIFIHDRRSGMTTRMSVASDGGEGDDNSYAGSVSGDGRFVVFFSNATDLVGDDTNGFGDVFVRGPLS